MKLIDKIKNMKKKDALKVGCYAEHYVSCWGQGLALGLFFRLLLDPLFKKGGVWQVVGTVLYCLFTFPTILFTSEWKMAKLSENIDKIEDEYYDDF